MVNNSQIVLPICFTPCWLYGAHTNWFWRNLLLYTFKTANSGA